MPSLIETLKDLFGTTDLYECLGVVKGKEANNSEIKRGYHKKSLEFHPDRVPEEGRAGATKKFQALGAVYKILSDQEKKNIYDESGEIDEESDASLQQDRDWDQYWRLLFKKITPQDVANFEKEYRHSTEELNDLKQIYNDSEGDMEYILDNMLCCSDDDQERFTDVIMEWVKNNEVTFFKKFRKLTATQSKKRKRKADKEAMEADELATELGLNKPSSDDDLVRMIAQRQDKRAQESESFLDSLAEKYGSKKSKPKPKPKKK